MSKLISQYATFADYMAACDGDSSKRVAHYAEQERQAAEEAQQAKDAARYQWLAARLIGYDFNWGEPQASIAAFEIPKHFRGGRDIGAAIDAAIAAEQ